MRLRIFHETAYHYGLPANRAIQTLRLAPRSHEGQFVIDWRLEVDHDCRLDAAVDAFGNMVHSFTVDGPLDRLTITAIGEVETEDTHGVIRGQVERFPPTLFLRDTPLTEADAPIRRLAAGAGTATSDPIDRLHRLMADLRDAMRFDVTRTEVTTTAAEALKLKHGVCQDFAHIFIAAARHLGTPARYVSGYLYRPEAEQGQDAGHGWAEAHVPGIGWIGFDPTNVICPTDAYVRLAVGLDYLGAAPVRGTRYGGGDETLDVHIRIADARPGKA